VTRNEALDILGLPDDANPGDIRRAFEEAYADLRIRLNNAPTQRLHEGFSEQLKRRAEAYSLLTGERIPDRLHVSGSSDVDERSTPERHRVVRAHHVPEAAPNNLPLHELVDAPAALEGALRRGADPNARDAAGNTPLHAVVWRDNPQAVRILLEHGADPNARNRRGVPVLHEAIRRKRKEMSLLLIEAGAAVDDHADDDGSTPLHWAAKAGWTDSIPILLARGAAVDAMDAADRTPLQWVLLRDRPSSTERCETVRCLLDGGAAHSTDTAISRGSVEHVREWISRGNRSFAQSGDGAGMLRKGIERLWRMMFSRPAVRATLSDGRSPLALAAAEAHPAVVRFLLEAGAHPDGEAFDPRSPLLCAIQARRVDVAEILLDTGANPEWGGRGQIRPIDEAIEHSRWSSTHLEFGSLLLSRGARPRRGRSAASLPPWSRSGRAPARG
jgi:ankyrin repeat protein